MKDSYEKLMRKLPEREPRAGFIDSLFEVLARAAKRRARVRFVGSLGLFTVSGGVLVGLVRFLSVELMQSGAYQYVSLVFSDSGTAFSFWREFALSIVESTPFLGVASVLAAAFVVLMSMRLVLKNFQPSFALKHA